MRLAQNGKLSSGRRTRHINIRYFFITDRIARNEVAIQYCPTKKMVADYFTKPLQGALFYKLRDQIMGVVEMETILGIDPINHRSVLESDKLNSNNVDDGNKLNKLKFDQSDLESDLSNLESYQSDTTNTGNESNGKTGRTVE